MNFVIFLISWFRTYLMGINEYAGSILIMSVIFYILVWGLKKALPEFWAIKLYDKTSVKVVKKEDGTSEIVRVKSEKRMNTLIPLFVSFAGFIVFLFLTKINTQTSAIAGGACALLASTIDNMLSIVANTLSTVFELVKRLFGKMSSKKKEVNKNEERIENLEGKIDALVNALAPKTSAYNSKDTQQG